MSYVLTLKGQDGGLTALEAVLVYVCIRAEC
jgi:hypothetical protein